MWKDWKYCNNPLNNKEGEENCTFISCPIKVKKI